MAFVPVTASAHPGHHDGQAKVQVPHHRLAMISPETAQRGRPSEFAAAFQQGEVCSLESKAPCEASKAHASCGGACCCSGMGSSVICLAVEALTITLFSKEAGFFVPAPGRLRGITPSAPLEPPNAPA
jgi:hypothetical protein